MGDHLVANEEAIEMPAENDGHVERFDKDGSYSKREWRMPGDWWNNQILSQHGEEWTNVALLDDHLNLCKVLRSEVASMWGHNARRIRLVHGQWYVGIDQTSKWLQECRMQMSFPH